MTFFAAATTPARWLGRFRPDLRRATAADAARFGGRFPPVVATVTLIAICYPIVASLVHAYGPPTQWHGYLRSALWPFYDVLYSESLPFMIAAAAVGLFSPALGVLFMAVFIPADLWAAAISGVELRTPPWFRPLPAAVVGRLASVGLLWILAVEIPLLTRRWALAWAGRGPSLPAPRDIAIGRIAAAGLLVFLWARTLPWLVAPAFTWNFVQVLPPRAMVPTFSYWWIPMLAAMLAAGITSARSLADPELMLEAAIEDSQRPRRSLAAVLIRQLVAVAILALLLGGLMTTRAEAVVLIAGLLLAGPVLTPVLPRIPVPAFLASAPRIVRWIVGMVLALGVSGVIFAVAYDALFEKDYFVLTVALAVALPVFRIVLDAGRVPLTRAALVLALLLPLASPAIALADDCRDTTVQEARSCAHRGVGKTFPMLGAAIAAVATAIALAKGRPDADIWPERFPSGYRHYQRSSLLPRIWQGIKRALGEGQGQGRPTRPAVSGVRA